MATLAPIVQRLEHENLGLLVVNGEGTLLFASDRLGIDALKTAHFERPDLLDGSDIAVVAVGLATAYLLILSKTGRIFTRIMSQEARAVLDEEGIEHTAGSYVKKLPEKFRAPMEALDARAAEAVTPQAFVEDLRRLRA